MARVFLVLIGLHGLAFVASAQGSLPAIVPSAFDYPSVIGQLVILITTIAGFIYTIFREARHRRWDLEDRARVAEDLKREQATMALELKVEQEKMAVELKREQEKMATQVVDHQVLLASRVIAQQEVMKTSADQKQREVLRKIDENTEISKAAHKEANDVNRKIAKLAEAYDLIKGRTTALETDGRVATS